MAFRRLLFGLTIVVIAGIGVRLSGVSFDMFRSGEADTTYITAPVERGDVSTYAVGDW